MFIVEIEVLKDELADLEVLVVLTDDSSCLLLARDKGLDTECFVHSEFIFFDLGDSHLVILPGRVFLNEFREFIDFLIDLLQCIIERLDEVSVAGQHSGDLFTFSGVAVCIELGSNVLGGIDEVFVINILGISSDSGTEVSCKCNQIEILHVDVNSLHDLVGFNG